MSKPDWDMEDVTVKYPDARAIYENLRRQLPDEDAEDMGTFDSWTDPGDALHGILDEVLARAVVTPVGPVQHHVGEGEAKMTCAEIRARLREIEAELRQIAAEPWWFDQYVKALGHR